MADVDIQVDTRQFDRALRHVARQAPFAIALSLTRTAQVVQAELRKDLPGQFTIRTPWVAKGIQVQAAKKKSPVAAVGSRDGFMREQAEGATTKGVVPTKHVRKTAKTVLRKGRWAKTLQGALAKNRILTDTEGNLRQTLIPGLWQRKGRKRYPIRLLYKFDSSVTIPQRWPFGATFSDVARRAFPREVAKAIERVLAEAERGR